ncbi:hypothetical protein G4228_016988 [Cervus hanglu yarkandensis]|nr:hypothetical protein G4228_016988 [Cervus hanglu yarkandensis]
MRSGAYCMRVSRSCSSQSTDIWKSASSDSTGGGSESSRARISSKLSSSTSSTRYLLASFLVSSRPCSAAILHTCL